MVKSIFKSIWAIVAGILVGAVLSILTDIMMEKIGIFPPATSPELYVSWMLAIALIYRGVYTVVSGYVTARLAPTRPMRHAMILAIIGTVVTILGSIANWDKTTPETTWYPIVLTFITVPCIWLGAKTLKSKGSADLAPN